MEVKKGRIKAGDREFIKKVVYTGRVSKAVKGGDTFQFRALVVIGDKQGVVGIGMRKSKEAGDAIRKATQAARNNLQRVPIWKGTISHELKGKCEGAYVSIWPASPGTGIIAGSGVREVLECVGIQNALTKSLGSTNRPNRVKATLDALSKLCDPLMVARRRGVSLDKVFNG